MPAQPHIEVHVGDDGRRIEISCDCPIGREHDFARWIEVVRGEQHSVIGKAAR